MNVNIVVAGREYDLAQAIPAQLTLPERASLDDALQALAQLLGPGRQLPASCLLAVSGQHLGTLGSHQPSPLADGDEAAPAGPRGRRLKLFCVILTRAPRRFDIRGRIRFAKRSRRRSPSWNTIL